MGLSNSWGTSPLQRPRCFAAPCPNDSIEPLFASEQRQEKSLQESRISGFRPSKRPRLGSPALQLTSVRSRTLFQLFSLVPPARGHGRLPSESNMIDRRPLWNPLPPWNGDPYLLLSAIMSQRITMHVLLSSIEHVATARHPSSWCGTFNRRGIMEEN